jgi:hypothetical protein
MTYSASSLIKTTQIYLLKDFRAHNPYVDDMLRVAYTQPRDPSITPSLPDLV